jgi:uncharacterized protein YndB with AHSA1/START domain
VGKRGDVMVKVLIGVVAVVLVLAVFVASRPPTFRVERSVVIAAPAERVFLPVSDFRAWPSWSPYEKKDPQMQRTYGPTTSGAGATYAWAGNNQVGEGRMTILRSDAPSVISIQLEFLKPFAATNTATFTFVPTAEGTRATWAMDGKSNFMTKAIGLVMDMDKMIGTDFEQGLASLKTLAETASNATARAD